MTSGGADHTVVLETTDTEMQVTIPELEAPMKTFVMRVDTAREQRDRHFSQQKPIFTNSKPRRCKLLSRGARALTANQQSRSGAMLSSVGGSQKQPRSRKLPRSDAPLARGDEQRTDGSDHDEQRVNSEKRQRKKYDQQRQW